MADVCTTLFELIVAFYKISSIGEMASVMREKVGKRRATHLVKHIERAS